MRHIKEHKLLQDGEFSNRGFANDVLIALVDFGAPGGPPDAGMLDTPAFRHRVKQLRVAYHPVNDTLIRRYKQVALCEGAFGIDRLEQAQDPRRLPWGSIDSALYDCLRAELVFYYPEFDGSSVLKHTREAIAGMKIALERPERIVRLLENNLKMMATAYVDALKSDSSFDDIGTRLFRRWHTLEQIIDEIRKANRRT